MGMRQESRLQRFFGPLHHEMSFWEFWFAVGATLGEATTVRGQWNAIRQDTTGGAFGRLIQCANARKSIRRAAAC